MPSSKKEVLKLRPLSPIERAALERSQKFVKDVSEALLKLGDLIRKTPGTLDVEKVVELLHPVQEEATKLEEKLGALPTLKFTMPAPIIGPNGVETSTSRALRDSISAAQRGELPVQKKDAATKREWHGCSNPAGHKFVTGICEDCGQDILTPSQRADAKPPPEEESDPNPAFRKPLFAANERLRLGERGFSQEDIRKIRSITARLVEGRILNGTLDPEDPAALKAAIKQAGTDALQAYNAAQEYLCG